MVPLLVDQVRDRRSEADVQVTTDVRSAYAGRVVLAVSSISSDIGISESRRQSQSTLRPHQMLSEKVRESQPVSFQAETSSNVSDWRVGAKFSLSFQVHHYELQLVRKRLVPPPCLGIPSVPGLRFVLLYLSGGPGADALVHSGSLPGCAEQGLLFPEGGKVVV